MLPFIYEEEELPFKKDDFIFVPNIAEAVKNKTTEIPAYVVGDELKMCIRDSSIYGRGG